MTDEASLVVIVAVATGIIASLALRLGYQYGKAAGIRESMHLLDEQRRDFEELRNRVLYENEDGGVR
jgi:hypothetical protein